MWSFLQNLWDAGWLYIIIGGVIVLGFVALFLVACIEKQRVRDFDPASPESLPPPSPYFQAMNDSARMLGFTSGGIFGQSREGTMYRCCLALWVSPDRLSLLIIGGGKLARMNYKRTWLVSKYLQGPSLVTMDEFGVEDLSGTRNIDVLKNADVTELYTRHIQRLSALQAHPQPFRETNLLGEYNDLNQIRVDSLVSLGLAKFIEPTCNVWRYTIKGAFKNAYVSATKGAERAESQQYRNDKKRPGS